MIIYADEKREFDLTDDQISATRSKKIKPAHITHIEKMAMSSTMSDYLKKIGESPTEWTLLEGICGPWACVPNKVADIILTAAEKARGKAARAKEEESTQIEQKTREIITACPSNMAPCTQIWNNGDLCSAEYRTMDGGKILGSDLIKNQGMGIYYLPKPEVKPVTKPVAAKEAIRGIAKTSDPYMGQMCPNCGTVCYGDCNS